MIALWSSDHNNADFAKLITVIAAWSTYTIQANFAILTVIAAWSTDNVQADFAMLTVIAAWSTDNINQVSLS